MLQLNKEDVSRILANKKGVSRSEAGSDLDLVLASIIETLSLAQNEEPDAKGFRGKLIMVGFGSFFLKAVPERMHRNPVTQEPAPKPAHNSIKFTEGKLLYDEINALYEET